MVRVRQLIEQLSDAPNEAIVVALAHAIFQLESATEKRTLRCFDEVDDVLTRLRSLGFDVVRTFKSYPNGHN